MKTTIQVIKDNIARDYNEHTTNDTLLNNIIQYHLTQKYLTPLYRVMYEEVVTILKPLVGTKVILKDGGLSAKVKTISDTEFYLVSSCNNIDIVLPRMYLDLPYLTSRDDIQNRMSIGIVRDSLLEEIREFNDKLEEATIEEIKDNYYKTKEALETLRELKDNVPYKYLLKSIPYSL